MFLCKTILQVPIESETYYVKYKVNIIQNKERTNQENMPRKSIASMFGKGISSFKFEQYNLLQLINRWTGVRSSVPF